MSREQPKNNRSFSSNGRNIARTPKLERWNLEATTPFPVAPRVETWQQHQITNMESRRYRTFGTQMRTENG